MATNDSTQLSARATDISGKRFGFQVALSFAETRKKVRYWNVRCDCGFERPVSERSLKEGRSTRCKTSCPANPVRADETGNKYGRLMVLRHTGNTNSGDTKWLCLCNCGQKVTVARGDLRKRYGGTKSCGCGRKTQGGGWDTPEYKIWKGIKRRCYQPNCKEYHLYGGRGIAVCERWLTNFQAFLSDMGPRPSDEHSTERRDNDGNYEPGNCYWATPLEQSQNTRKVRLLTYKGETMSLRAWGRRLGITHRTLSARIERGWPEDRIFSSNTED